LEFVAELAKVVEPSRHARLFVGAEITGKTFGPVGHTLQVLLQFLPPGNGFAFKGVCVEFWHFHKSII
jgi:hypothetical protein